MADHFTLDVDPGQLRKTAGEIETLRTNVMAKGNTVTGTPGEVGDGWTGDTATQVKAEMETLGGRMVGLGGFLFPISEGLRELARKYDTALEALPDLNRRWNAAQTTYDEAVTASEQQMGRDEDALRDDNGRPNRFLQHEIENGHTNRVSTAATARDDAQDAIQAEYDAIVEQLELDTGALGTTLNDQTPVDVTADQLEAWHAGSWPTPDMSTMLIGLELTAARTEVVARDEVSPEVQEDIDDLYQALSDNDTDAIAAAMDAIGDNADNDVYADVLVEMYGPEGIRALYREVNERANNDDINGYELADNLLNMNETIAAGISRTDDAYFNAFYDALSEEPDDARILALLASADTADGRLNTAAMSVHRNALSYPSTMPSDADFYIEALQQAFDGDLGSAGVEHFVQHSDADDLAAVLRELEPGEEVTDFMNGFNPVDVTNAPGSPGVYDDEIPNELAERYGNVLTMLRDEHLEALADDPTANPDLLLQLLNDRENLIGVGNYPYEILQPHINDVIEDPEFVSWYLHKLGNPGVSRGELQDIMRETDPDVESLMAGIIQHRLSQGENQDEIANALGNMLRADDLAGEEYDPSGVIQAMGEEVLGALPTDAVTGPALSILEALTEESDRIDELIADAGEDEQNEHEQELLAFQLYTMANQDTPPGFDDFAAQYGQDADPQTVLDYIDELRRQRGEGWEELQGYIDEINRGRDDT